MDRPYCGMASTPHTACGSHTIHKREHWSDCHASCHGVLMCDASLWDDNSTPSDCKDVKISVGFYVLLYDDSHWQGAWEARAQGGLHCQRHVLQPHCLRNCHMSTGSACRPCHSWRCQQGILLSAAG